MLLPKLDGGREGLAKTSQLTQHLHVVTTPDKLKHPAAGYSSCVTGFLSFKSSLKLLREKYYPNVYFKAVQIICLDPSVELTRNILF